jgi:hypothetical protein
LVALLLFLRGFLFWSSSFPLRCLLTAWLTLRTSFRTLRANLWTCFPLRRSVGAVGPGFATLRRCFPTRLTFGSGYVRTLRVFPFAGLFLALTTRPVFLSFVGLTCGLLAIFRLCSLTSSFLLTCLGLSCLSLLLTLLCLGGLLTRLSLLTLIVVPAAAFLLWLVTVLRGHCRISIRALWLILLARFLLTRTWLVRALLIGYRGWVLAFCGIASFVGLAWVTLPSSGGLALLLSSGICCGLGVLLGPPILCLGTFFRSDIRFLLRQ